MPDDYIKTRASSGFDNLINTRPQPQNRLINDDGIARISNHDSVKDFNTTLKAIESGVINYNNAVIAFSNAVESYNITVEDYNIAVESYNIAVEDYDNTIIVFNCAGFVYD